MKKTNGKRINSYFLHSHLEPSLHLKKKLSREKNGINSQSLIFGYMYII